jgi:hypothetical protein
LTVAFGGIGGLWIGGCVCHSTFLLLFPIDNGCEGRVLSSPRVLHVDDVQIAFRQVTLAHQPAWLNTPQQLSPHLQPSNGFAYLGFWTPAAREVAATNGSESVLCSIFGSCANDDAMRMKDDRNKKSIRRPMSEAHTTFTITVAVSITIEEQALLRSLCRYDGHY